MAKFSEKPRPGPPPSEMRGGLIGCGGDADRHYRDSRWFFSAGHIHLLPLPDGTLLSNCFFSNGAIGIFGNSGPAVCAAAGSTMVGVTITMSSEFVLFTVLERKSCPMIGRSPI